MIVCTTKKALQEQLAKFRHDGKVIGFVPTMGALHSGHISLVDASKAKCAVTVCSIFINPTQFNDKKDFEKYPVTIDADKAMLEKAGCDILFLPTVKEMYPDGLVSSANVSLGLLGRVMEAAHRPGHFEGVVQVVKILLDAVRPDYLFMGQKDFQQCAVIARLIRQYRIPVELVICPTRREPGGLAMSSRNMRLTQTQRDIATILSAVLLNMHRDWKKFTPHALKKKGLDILKDQEGLKAEYLELVDADTLRPIRQWKGHEHVQACVAAYMGDVRLIDNVNIF